MSLKDLIVDRTPDEAFAAKLDSALARAAVKVRSYYPDDRIAHHVLKLVTKDLRRAFPSPVVPATAHEKE